MHKEANPNYKWYLDKIITTLIQMDWDYILLFMESIIIMNTQRNITKILHD